MQGPCLIARSSSGPSRIGRGKGGVLGREQGSNHVARDICGAVGEGGVRPAAQQRAGTLASSLTVTGVWSGQPAPRSSCPAPHSVDSGLRNSVHAISACACSHDAFLARHVMHSGPRLESITVFGADTYTANLKPQRDKPRTSLSTLSLPGCLPRAASSRRGEQARHPVTSLGPWAEKIRGAGRRHEQISPPQSDSQPSRLDSAAESELT